MIPLKDINPARRAPVVTVALILANIVVYVLVVTGTTTARDIPTQAGTLRVSGRTAFDLEHAAVPCELVQRRPLVVDEVLDTYNRGDASACATGAAVDRGAELFPQKDVALSILYSMFLHGGLAHLGFNMLFLWVFGNNVEDRLGHLPYLVFYLAGGLVATLADVAVGPASTVPVIGASGAIAAVMGAYLFWFPRALVITYIPPIFVLPLRARWLLALWFILQFFTASGSGVAWVAHVGGFIFGALVALTVGRPARPAGRALRV